MRFTTLSWPCGMLRLLAALDGLQLANSRLVFAVARSGGWRPRSNRGHRLILQALRAYDVDRACDLLARHIQAIERLSISATARGRQEGADWLSGRRPVERAELA